MSDLNNAMWRCNAILAENDGAMRGWMRRVLAGHGIWALEAVTGVETLLLVTCPPPADFIISGLRTPLLDGLEVLAMLRAVDLRMPFLLVTEQADRDLRRAVEALDARVLERPFSAGELIACVASLVPGLATGSGRSGDYN